MAKTRPVESNKCLGQIEEAAKTLRSVPAPSLPAKCSVPAQAVRFWPDQYFAGKVSGNEINHVVWERDQPRGQVQAAALSSFIN